jgi:hypothetical protein
MLTLLHSLAEAVGISNRRATTLRPAVRAIRWARASRAKRSLAVKPGDNFTPECGVALIVMHRWLRIVDNFNAQTQALIGAIPQHYPGPLRT